MSSSATYNDVHNPVVSKLECTIRVPTLLTSLELLDVFVRTFCHIMTPQKETATADFVRCLELAVHEAAMNIVRHSFGGGADDNLTLEIAFSAGQYIVTLCDPAPAFTIPPPAILDPHEPREGGYGVLLIRQLMDEVEYSRHNDMNYVRLTKNIDGVAHD